MIGVIIRDADTGTVVLNVSDRLTRILGQVSTGGTNGSLSVPAFSQGTPFAFPVIMNPSDPAAIGAGLLVTISGTTLSWTYTSPSSIAPATSAIIYYGLY